MNYYTIYCLKLWCLSKEHWMMCVERCCYLTSQYLKELLVILCILTGTVLSLIILDKGIILVTSLSNLSPLLLANITIVYTIK
jgi:hypothetical protein